MCFGTAALSIVMQNPQIDAAFSSADTIRDTVVLMQRLWGCTILAELIQGGILYAGTYFPLKYRLNLN